LRQLKNLMVKTYLVLGLVVGAKISKIQVLLMVAGFPSKGVRPPRHHYVVAVAHRAHCHHH